jgi:NADH-quinone oxidoreductase subunit N
LLASWHFRNEGSVVADIYALMIFALTGALLMTSFSNLVMLFIGVEILSIALYILAGSRRLNLSSNEASLKYFLMGSFASGILLFGITLLFGVVNSFDLASISDYVSANNSLPLIFHTGIMLVLIGFAFKIGAVPFHFWAPDVYQGSPTLITTFMATVVKIAGIAAFFRLFDTCFSGIDTSGWYRVLWVICILTILFGNISALLQNEAKRLVAWSGVAHSGYLLIPLLALNELSAPAIFYYTTAYAVASIGVFAVILSLGDTENEVPLERFKGLAKNNPLLTFALLTGMFSLAGIPPLAGFFGKYYLFANALSNGLIIVTVIAVIGSLVGIYYYFRPVIFAFNTDVPPVQKINNGFAFNFVLMLCIFLTLLLGLFPDILANLPF